MSRFPKLANKDGLKLQEPDMVEESCQYLPNFKA